MCSGFQVFQENAAPELFQVSEFVCAALYEPAQNPDVLGVTFAGEQTNFLGDVLRTLKFGTDVSTKKKVFSLVVGGRAAKYECVLRLSCISF